MIWQEQYKDQVEVMGQQYKQSVESLVETRQAVSGIWKECENIPIAMDQLKEVLNVNQHQISELQRHLETFLQMREAAIEAVPTIKAQLEMIGDHLTSSSTQVKEHLQKASDELLDSSKAMHNSLSSTQEQINLAMQGIATNTKNITNNIEDIAKNFETTSTKVLATVRNHTENTVRDSTKLIEQAHANLSKHLNEATLQTGNTINKQLEQLEKATVQEIETAMEAMGKALVAITGRFVQDYKIMTEAMEKVVAMAGRK